MMLMGRNTFLETEARCFSLHSVSRAPLVSIVLLALFVLKPTSGTASATDPPEIEAAIARLEIATTSYPDDPALEWAYAQALARGGQFEPAVARMERYAKRWPTRRQDVHLALGRLLFEAGRHEAARKRLETAVRLAPRSGIARFYYALTLRALGLRSEARAELVRSGKMETGLLADSTLLLSIDAFAAGEEEEGIELARRVIDLDPTSDAAARARMLLWDKDLAPASHPLRVDAYVGMSYDDNVTLTANKDDAEASGKDDIRGVWGLGLAWRQKFGDRTQFMSGYRFDQAEYEDRDEFNFINNALYTSALLRVHPRVSLRLDLIGWNTLQEGQQFLWAGTARPALLFALPKGYGFLRGFANFEFRDFDAKAGDPSLEQDGWTFGAGLEWTVPIPIVGGTYSLSGSFHETLTESKTSPFSAAEFSGDYDRTIFLLLTRVRVPIGWEFNFGGDLSYSRSWYRHNSLLDFLNELITTPSIDIDVLKRRDHLVEGRVFLARPLHRLVTLEVEWKRSHRMSNSKIYDFKRHIAGMVLRVQSR